MAYASAFDYPIWKVEILLTWLRRQAGVPNDDAAIEEFRRQALIEIEQQAAAGKLEIYGRRCRLEFPDRIVLEGTSGHEMIPRLEFIDGDIWPFQCVYVLTPPAWFPVKPEFLTTRPSGAPLPPGVREAIEAARPFQWWQPGHQLPGWRDLMVDAEGARALWEEQPVQAEPAAASTAIKKRKKRTPGPDLPKRRRPGEVFPSWLAKFAEAYPDGIIPPEDTDKELARKFTAETKITISDRHVRRLLRSK